MLVVRQLSNKVLVDRLPPTGRQKLAQLDNSNLMELLDITLLWTWLKPRLANLLGNLDKVAQMWSSGTEIPSRFLPCNRPLQRKRKLCQCLPQPKSHDNRLFPRQGRILMGFPEIP